MSLQDKEYDNLDTVRHRGSTNKPLAGEPDRSGVSSQYTVVETDQPTVKADVEERQAVEVRPMRYVLGLGIGLAIIAMFIVWLLMR